MKNLAQSWGLYQDAKTWGCRPSELLGIDEPYPAYCFDQAIGAWGNHIISELEKIEDKNPKKVANKRRNRLMALLEAPAEQRFQSFRNPTGKK